MTPDGYILTNNHVVDGATGVRVTLADKREFKAKVIGADPKSDIAVLKIDATDLPCVTVGDSSKVQVGDYALAVGNPFGVGQTVTMGIVSATGRSHLGIEEYEDFIQTDAPINPGNSGGALVNDRGELIGINTAIIAHGSEGNQGIGFAIPVNMARNVMEQIGQERESHARLPGHRSARRDAGHRQGFWRKGSTRRAGGRRQRQQPGAEERPGKGRHHSGRQWQAGRRQQRPAHDDLHDAAGCQRQPANFRNGSRARSRGATGRTADHEGVGQASGENQDSSALAGRLRGESGCADRRTI